MRLGKLERYLDDLDALALQHVGKPRVVLEVGVIKRGDQPALVTIPIVKQRGDDAARLELGVEADAVVKLEGCRMIGPGARHLLQEIVFAARLDEADRDILLRQCKRQA